MNKCMKCHKLTSDSTRLCDVCWDSWSKYYDAKIHTTSPNRLFDVWLDKKSQVFIFR